MEAHGQLHVPAALIPVEITPDTDWERDWVGHRAGVSAVGRGEGPTHAGNRTHMPTPPGQ
jgi:hypothetical protein